MIRLTVLLIIVFIAFLASGCKDDHPDLVPEPPGNMYEFLPENMIARSDDGSLTARYVDPVTRYAHGILGDKIEAGGLLVVKDDKPCYFKLEETFVFEDLQPRLYDVDQDGDLEIIVIQTNITSGASVQVYKINNGMLHPYMRSEYIGTSHRWLNIAAIDDLDNDGYVEIAWIETPHIGGTLKIGRVVNDSLQLLIEKEGVSNHRIGSGNLCLSVLTESDGQKTLYVPDNPHQSIVGFQFLDDRLISMDTVSMTVDPSIPLFLQYDFQNRLDDKNCIYSPLQERK